MTMYGTALPTCSLHHTRDPPPRSLTNRPLHPIPYVWVTLWPGSIAADGRAGRSPVSRDHPPPAPITELSLVGFLAILVDCWTHAVHVGRPALLRDAGVIDVPVGPSGPLIGTGPGTDCPGVPGQRQTAGLFHDPADRHRAAQPSTNAAPNGFGPDDLPRREWL
jgi:hypothetical protein